jgi:hypothetical protein
MIEIIVCFKYEHICLVLLWNDPYPTLLVGFFIRFSLDALLQQVA